MVLPVLAAFAKAAAPYVLPAIAGAINQKSQNKAAMNAYNAQRAAEKADQANKFVDMRNAAQRAGFNPLTVLRATGGAGFGGTNAVMPVMSKQNFAATLAAKAVGQYFTNVKNAPIDKYNEQVRQLELEKRRLDIKLSKQTLLGMTQNRNGVMPKVPDNVLSSYSLGNEHLATIEGNVTTDTRVTPTETGVDSRGNTYRKPAGDDLDEQLLNSVYHGVQQLRYGVLDAWNWMRNGQRPPDMPTPTFDPNLPVITNQTPQLSRLRFGPNYADRFSLDGFAYNY